MKSYLFSLGIALLAGLFLSLQFMLDWSAPDEQEFRQTVIVAGMMIFGNYLMILRLAPGNEYRNYRHFYTTDLTAAGVVLREVRYVLWRGESLVLFATLLLFFLTMFGHGAPVRLILLIACTGIYFIVLNLLLICVRFFMGHSEANWKNFVLILFSFNALSMFQFNMITNQAGGWAARLFIDFNPLNTLYYLPVMNEATAGLFLITLPVAMAVSWRIAKTRMQWEHHLERS